MRPLFLGGYSVLAKMQNKSGHGIDVIARDNSGKLVFLEVKTSRTGRAGRLTDAQSRPGQFIKERLQRAAQGRGQWANISPRAQRAARNLYREIKSGKEYDKFKVDVKFNPKNLDAPPGINVSTW